MGKIICNEKIAFYMHTLIGMANRGSSCVLQIFYLSLVLNFRGLSKNAIDMTSNLKFTLPKTTFRRYWNAELKKIQENNR